MGRMSHRNHERTERRISAATSLLMCALTVLAQIAVTLLLVHFLKEKASFVYALLQLIGVVVAIRVYQRTGSPSYKLSWMCLLLILPVSGMICIRPTAPRLDTLLPLGRDASGQEAELEACSADPAAGEREDAQRHESCGADPPQPYVGTAVGLSSEAGILALPKYQRRLF